MTSTVEIGEIKFKLPDGTWMNAIVSDGLVEVDHNKVDVLVYSAEKPEEIDKFRAEAALERAKEQLRHKAKHNGISYFAGIVIKSYGTIKRCTRLQVKSD